MADLIWIYDSVTKTATSDLRDGIDADNYELEVTNNVKSAKGISIINPEIINWTTFDLTHMATGNIDGGSA
jgi:hypothetical protein